MPHDITYHSKLCLMLLKERHAGMFYAKMFLTAELFASLPFDDNEKMKIIGQFDKCKTIEAAENLFRKIFQENFSVDLIS